jgi:surface carbohydrate biosynthesis protein
MTVYFPYETKNRELDGKLLLSSYLLNKGYEIVIGSRKAVRTEALSHTNGIYFFKSLSVEEKGLYRQLKFNKHHLALLHAEGGIHYKNNDENILSCYNKDLLPQLDENFIFGTAIQKSITKLTNFTHSTISGEPRFDLLKSKYHSYFKDDIKQLKNTYNDFILVNTNFGLSNSYVGEEKLLKYYEKEKTLSAEAKKLLLFKFNFLKEVFNDYLVALSKLAEAFPQLNFVIRAHPSESEDAYHQLSKRHPNIHVVKEGNVAKWIIASKAVIHYDCTTGMEAALANIPVISFVPKKDDRILAWLPVALSQQATTTDELIHKVHEILNAKQYQNNISNELREVWLSFVHNVSFESSEIIVQKLMESVNNKSKTQPVSLSKLFKLYFQRRKRDLKYYKDSFNTKRSITRDKFGELSVAELNYKISMLHKINGFNQSFKVVKLANDLFKVIPQ